MRTAVVYGIRNIRTGKYYVGSSRELSVRWSSHKKLLESNCHTPKLQDAWNESTPDDWAWEILEKEIPIIHQFESEQHWIDSLDSYENGYNTSPRAGSYVSIDNRGYDAFTEQRKDQILEMLVQIEQGRPYRQIASDFGVSHGFVGNLKRDHSDLLTAVVEAREAERQRVALSKERLEKRKLDRLDRDAKILALVNQGLSYREVAKLASCAVGTVGNVVSRTALTTDRR